MAKRVVINRNVMALTRKRTPTAALTGWTVAKRIAPVASMPSLACRLCGTRFRRGAWVSHPGHRPLIPIGGTCLVALLLKRFPERGEFSAKRRTVSKTLKAQYGHRIDPGDWIQWVVDHAPRGLAREAAELEHCGATATAPGLRKLIRFHDRTCLYPVSSLLDDWDEDDDFFDFATEITIDQARRAIRALNSGERLARRAALAKQRCREAFLAEENHQMEDVQTAWTRLNGPSRRTVIALYELSDRLKDGNVLCETSLAEKWPLLGRPQNRIFCWHSKLGLGLIEAGEDDEDSIGKVWLAAQGEYRVIRDFRSWRSVKGAPANAVAQLEALAFARPVPPLEES